MPLIPKMLSAKRPEAAVFKGMDWASCHINPVLLFKAECLTVKSAEYFQQMVKLFADFICCLWLINAPVQKVTSLPTIKLSWVTRKCALRSLSLSYPKKDWRAGPRQSFFWYATDYEFVICNSEKNATRLVSIIPFFKAYWKNGSFFSFISPPLVGALRFLLRHIFSWHNSFMSKQALIGTLSFWFMVFYELFIQSW